jgi:uncharacterized protein YbbK (DUF523 family)
MEHLISVGVSSCLLGETVRYDGGHKHDRRITDDLGRLFRLVPVCPEVGCGLSVPREAMRLEGDPMEPRLVTINSRVDLTEQMAAWCREAVPLLARERLCGFIFKKNSPSCEPFSVQVHHGGVPLKGGRGMFAAAFVAHFPLLPVEEEERLADPTLRAAFVERVLACRRGQELLHVHGRPGTSQSCPREGAPHR